MENKKIKVYTTCRFCDKEFELEITQKQLDEFQSPNRRHIQDIFPELSPGMRELLISGMCPDCWDDMFGSTEF